MLVKCIANKGVNIPLEARYGETDSSNFNFLQLGSTLNVYGVQFYPCRLDYLVSPQVGNVHFVASSLFEIVDCRLPPDWSVCLPYMNTEYKVLHEQFQMVCLTGYHELVSSYRHYQGILNGDFDEHSLFFRAKLQIDEWQSRLPKYNFDAPRNDLIDYSIIKWLLTQH